MKSSTDYCAIPGNYGFKWPKLSELYELLFNLELQEAHNALVDVKATHKCFWKLVELNVIQNDKRKQKVNPSPSLLSNTYLKNNESTLSPKVQNSEVEKLENYWKGLSNEWKKLIISQIPKKRNPDRYFPFDPEYLPSIPIEGSLSLENVYDLKDYLGSAKKLETDTEVDDLNPLRKFLKLENLIIGRKYSYSYNFANKKISSILPLSNLTSLKTLDCHDCFINDISPLQNLSNLEEVNFAGCPINDISPINNLRKLRKANFAGCPITNINTVSNLTYLRDLNIRNTEVKTIEPIKHLQLVSFECSSLINNYRPLFNIESLLYLKLNNVESSNLLLGIEKLHNLVELDVTNSNLTDISPLSRLSKLIELNLSGTQVFDLEPLSRLPNLRRLIIDNTKVKSLRPIKNLIKLEYLSFDNTRIHAADTIFQLPNIKRLSCKNSILTDRQLTNIKKFIPDSDISKDKRDGFGCLYLLGLILFFIISYQFNGSLRNDGVKMDS